VARGALASSRDLAATMRGHGASTAIPDAIGDDWSGFTVCMHRSDMHAQTTASMIADLRDDGAPLRTWICLGNPCVSVYVPCFPPAVPVELASEATWHRFTRVRDRVEAHPDELEAIRAVLAPVEHDLWAAADTAAAGGTRAALDAFAAGAFAPV